MSYEQVFQSNGPGRLDSSRYTFEVFEQRVTVHDESSAVVRVCCGRREVWHTRRPRIECRQRIGNGLLRFTPAPTAEIAARLHSADFEIGEFIATLAGRVRESRVWTEVPMRWPGERFDRLPYEFSDKSRATLHCQFLLTDDFTYHGFLERS